MSFLKFRPLNHWAACSFSAFPIILLVKYRVLFRSSFAEKPLINVLHISALDFLTFSFLIFMLSLVVKKKHWLVGLSLLVLSTLVVGSIFLIKMGVPLSLGLISQIDGLFDLQTSIAAESSLRTLFFTVLLFVAYILMCCFFTYVSSSRSPISSIIKKKLRCFLITATVLLNLASAIFFTLLPNTLNDFSNNLFTGIFTNSSSQAQKELTTFIDQHNPPAMQWESVTAKPRKEKPNLLFILLESLSFQYIKQKEQFKTAMPFLHSISAKSEFYTNHYTPWPLSSKSLFSVICGQYPVTSATIEIRVAPNFPCKSWSKDLKKNGYNLFAAYSGDFKYDQMGSFLLNNGFQELIDKNDSLKKKNYEKNSWGIDDTSLVDAFSNFVAKNPDPFASFLIPINSHHPGWTPASFRAFPENQLFRTLNYQDKLIKDLFGVLKENKKHENTIVIITSDHGKSDSSTTLNPGTLNKTNYHIPLWIYSPSLSPKTVSHTTNHVELAGKILDLTGSAGEQLKNHNLAGLVPSFSFFSSPDVRFSIKKEKAVLHDIKARQTYIQENWVSETTHTSCSTQACSDQLKNAAQIIKTSLEQWDNFENF